MKLKEVINVRNSFTAAGVCLCEETRNLWGNRQKTNDCLRNQWKTKNTPPAERVNTTTKA